MTAQEGLGPLEPQGSPLWTLQHLGFVPDVAAALPTAERTVTPGRADTTTQLTREARLENDPCGARAFVQRRAPVGCIHVFGLFAQHRMAAGPDEVRRPAP